MGKTKPTVQRETDTAQPGITEIAKEAISQLSTSQSITASESKQQKQPIAITAVTQRKEIVALPQSNEGKQVPPPSRQYTEVIHSIGESLLKPWIGDTGASAVRGGLEQVEVKANESLA